MDSNSKVVSLMLSRMFLKNNFYRYATGGRDEHKPYNEYTLEDWETYATLKADHFLNFTLPAVQAQTNQDFEYLVFVDPTFPGYSSVCERMEAQRHLYTLIYTDMPWGDGVPFKTWKTWLPLFQGKVKAYVDKNYSNCRWLITHRLDADDIICNDFVESVADRFEEKERWILFSDGYMAFPSLEDPNVLKAFWHTVKKTTHPVYCEPFGDEVKTAYHRIHNKLGLPLPCDRALVVESEQGGDFTKGYWFDLSGYSCNVSRGPSGFTKFSPNVLSKAQQEDIRNNFTIKGATCDMSY